jgi:NADH-quinone oxidoreductase subunit C
MEIARRLQERFSEEVLDICDFQGQIGVIVKRDKIVEMLRSLRDGSDLRMDHLMDLCGVDNKNRPEADLQRFEVVYNLYSIPLRHSIRIRAQVPENDPCIDTITTLWKGADWHERECFDLMGISFTGHPDLRRILLPDDWQGHPLRKEYPLKGREEWSGLVELQRKAVELHQFDLGEGTLRQPAAEQSHTKGNDKS